MKKILFLYLLLFSQTLLAYENEPIKNNNTDSFEKELFIIGNFYDKEDRYIKLSDNTYWKINRDYNSTLVNKMLGIDKESIWRNNERIEILTSYNTYYPYIINNLDRNVKVEARQIDPLLEIVAAIKDDKSLREIAEAIKQLKLSPIINSYN
ncbi:MAG: hypothetical protein JXA94_01965 [Parachlamydiales bacterium]|nr:hypothetical protein [Parachlamydiales bacterium]